MTVTLSYVCICFMNFRSTVLFVWCPCTCPCTRLVGWVHVCHGVSVEVVRGSSRFIVFTLGSGDRTHAIRLGQLVPKFLCLIREKAVKTTSVTLVPKEGEG